MGAYLSLSGSGSGREVGWGGGGCLFEAGRLETFSAFRMGAYSRWALFRINTVYSSSKSRNFTDVCMVGDTSLPPTKQTSVHFRNLLAKDHFTNFKAPFSMVSTDFP